MNLICVEFEMLVHCNDSLYADSYLLRYVDKKYPYAEFITKAFKEDRIVK